MEYPYGRLLRLIATIALTTFPDVCLAFRETPFSSEEHMKVDIRQLVEAARVSEENGIEARPAPSIYCDIKVSQNKAERNVPGCATMALIFSDLQKFGAQTSTFLDNPQEANFLILTLSSKGMADFLQKISSSKIGVFEDFTQTPQYKDLGSCLIVNFKAYPAKYLIVLPELIDESVAYDCVVLGALFYLSYPPSLLKQKYLPLQRSFYLTGIEYSMLCLRNKGVSHFSEFDVAKLSDIEEMKLGFARYIGCKSPGE